MGKPTIYKRPTANLPPKKQSEQDKNAWKRHREEKERDVKIPRHPSK